MGAKIIRHPSLDPEKKAERDRRRAAQRRGFAGKPDDEGCAVKEKKSSFPWFTILMTGVVTAVGTVLATRAIKAMDSKRNEPEPSSTQKRMQDARDLLIMAAPTAGQNVPVNPMMHTAPVLMGPSQTEIELRERLSMLEGYLAQQVEERRIAAARPTGLDALLDAEENEEDDEEDDD